MTGGGGKEDVMFEMFHMSSDRRWCIPCIVGCLEKAGHWGHASESNT